VAFHGKRDGPGGARFYIIRRHITVEAPLDKRNLERRDRIFVRASFLKDRQVDAFPFDGICGLGLSRDLRTPGGSHPERRNLKFAGRLQSRRVVSYEPHLGVRSEAFRFLKVRRSLSCGRPETFDGIESPATKLISKARQDGTNETTKAFTRLTPNSFEANCPQRGCKLPLSADVYAHALSASPRLPRAR